MRIYDKFTIKVQKQNIKFSLPIVQRLQLMVKDDFPSVALHCRLKVHILLENNAHLLGFVHV